MESPRATRKAHAAAANAYQNSEQTQVEQSPGSLTRTKSPLDLIECREEILFNRQFGIPESASTNSYNDFFLEIYSDFLQSPYAFEGLAVQIFSESQQAQKFLINNYIVKLLSALAPYEKAEINSKILDLLNNLLDKVEFSFEMQLMLRDSLIAILNLSCFYINYIHVHYTLIAALKKLAIIQKDDLMFYTICWDAFTKTMQDSFNNYLFSNIATTLVEIDNDGTKSFPIIVEFMKTKDTAIGYKAAALLGIIASKETVDNSIYSQCLIELRKINDYQQFFYGFQKVKLKVFQDPELKVVFLNEILIAIKKFISFVYHPTAHHIESLLKDYIKILTEFPKVDCLTIETLVETLINQIQVIRGKGSDLDLQFFYTSLMQSLYTLTHKYRFYPSIAKRGLEFMYATLKDQNKEYYVPAAEYFREIVCTPECCKKEYLEEAFNMLNDKRSIIKCEAIEIVGYYRIHTELSEDEKIRCIRELRDARFDRDEGVAKRVIFVFQKIIQKRGELEEVKMLCYYDILGLCYFRENVNRCAINVLAELAAEISAWKGEHWRVCIIAFVNNPDTVSAVKALGRFAMLCGREQKIVEACHTAIVKSNLGIKKDQSSLFSVLGLLMRSPGINEVQIQECIHQIDDIIDNIEIKSDSFTGLIYELKETAQFWHTNISIANLIIDCLKRLLWNKGLSHKEHIIEILHFLTQISGIEDSLKKTCYITLLEKKLEVELSPIPKEVLNSTQTVMKISLSNNSVSPEIVKIYLEYCIRNLTKHKRSAHIGFANICFFYERHPEYLNSEVIKLIKEGKNKILKST